AIEIPRAADPNVLVERGRPVLGQHADVEDAGVHAVRKGEVDDAVFAGERHRRLRAALRQQTQPRAEAAGQHQRVPSAAHQPPAAAVFSRRSRTRSPAGTCASWKPAAPAPTPTTAPPPPRAPPPAPSPSP